MSRTRQIIEAYFKEKHPESVQKKFAAWLNEDRDTEEKNEILTGLWNSLNIEPDRYTEESFRKLQSKIDMTAHRNKRIFIIGNPFIRTLSRVAAFLLLPLLSAALTYLYLQKDLIPAKDIQLVECIVPNGEVRNIVLPDSSKVQLNAGSILIYPEHFGATRNVYLNGEAYFNVVRNEKHLFTVNTTDMEVEVLGTVFNVSSYSADENSSATLESGKVNVRFKNAGIQPVLLAPNERVSFNRNSGLVKKQAVKVDAVIAWTKGNLAIQGLSIDEITKTIERKYGLKVYLNSYRYKNERITMKVDNEENIDGFMNILQQLVPGLRYKIEGDKFYIY